MKIACCQFDPKWGDVRESMETADSLLERYDKGDIDILVLPEMAFSGYVFNSVQEIDPYLEDSETGPSVQWAKKQAIRLCCYVVVGYPQKKGDVNYNSQCVVGPDGQLRATYQKSFLYTTDENWAEEGPGFVSMNIDNLGKVGLGICMDLNPYQFKADFWEFEFGTYHLKEKTDIILCSMAWLKSNMLETQKIPSLVNYWVKRLYPLYAYAEDNKHTIVVVCNRIGTERGSVFAGTSCVLDISAENVTALGYLRDESKVLIVEI